MVKWRITPAIERARIKKAKRDCPTPILSPEDCISKAINDHEKLAVGWSGGKDSTLVVYMAIQQNPDIRVVFNDTGIEFPETYAFVDKIRDEWSLNLEVLKPETTFWDIVEEYGFPMLRGKYRGDNSSHGKDGRPMCCQLLKEKPILEAGLKCMLTGITVAESRMRMFAVAQHGQYYHAKTLKRWNYHPIAFWPREKVWKYTRDHDIPYNEVYDKGQDRCGCWPCTGYIGWKESLAESHPEMYRALARMVGEPTLWEYADIKGCRQEAPAPEDVI